MARGLNVVLQAGLNVLRQMRDVLMPRGCAGCDQPDQVLCPCCFERFHHYETFDSAGFEWAIGCTCAAYSGPVRRSILEWKDHDDREVTREFCAIVADLVERISPMLADQAEARLLLVPAPSSKQSLRRRGRVHLWPLAQAAAARLQDYGYQAYAQQVLSMRSVSGKAVQLRGAAARARRVSGHIQVTPGKDVAGQAIILIDDIVTTGSTARQCAAVLREAGAKPLTVLALARAGERSQGDLSSVCD